MADVDTRITPALHPDNIASQNGYTDATAPLVVRGKDVYFVGTCGRRSGNARKTFPSLLQVDAGVGTPGSLGLGRLGVVTQKTE